MVFDRSVDDRVLTFGVSGLLRDSNLIMWDHETESWWQQGTFRAIAGTHAGTRLDMLPAQTIAWADFREMHPDAEVLSRDTGHGRPYGTNPYEGYDTTQPFLFEGSDEVDERVPVMHRVVGVTLGDQPIAYPYRALIFEPVLYDERGGQEIVLLFDVDTTSPVDQREFRDGRPVGSVGVFKPVVDGRRLTLEQQEHGGSFVDQETGSTWTVAGRAIEGPLEGKRLPRVFTTQPFWFYWASAHPETEVYNPEVFTKLPSELEDRDE